MSNELKIRAEIQNLLDSNIIRAGGDFHVDELNEDCFINDIYKDFKLTPIEPGNSEEKLRATIKECTKKVRGLFNSRELKQRMFLKKLFEKFEIEKL